MRLQTLGAALAGLLAIAAPARADVRVTIENGHVSVIAHDATLSQILAEWARVGRARIINAERLAGPPVTLEITDALEVDALEILLRPVSGYLAAPRANPIANASQYDRIFLLPTSTGAPPRTSAPPAPRPIVFPQPNASRAGDAVDDDDDRPAGPRAPRQIGPNGQPAAEPGAVAPQPNGPRRPFTAFPQPQFQRAPAGAAPAPPSQPQTSTAPTAPIGVARPGMLVPAPPSAQQPGQPTAAADQDPQ
jgi:hypothetical protein